MGQQAFYRVQIPQTDHLGQAMHPDLPQAAHEWLLSQYPRLFHESWIEGPHTHRQGPVNHLVTIAQDDPMVDGYVKQLATHVGEMTNHPAIGASKSSDKGVQSWTIPNRKHVPGQGANSQFLEPPPMPIPAVTTPGLDAQAQPSLPAAV
jgi:hypothetical protein